MADDLLERLMDFVPASDALHSGDGPYKAHLVDAMFDAC